MGKGSHKRPTNKSKFDAGWERIYGNKDKNSVSNHRDNSNGCAEGVCDEAGSEDPSRWITRPQIP
jgi:hypothetical protein